MPAGAARRPSWAARRAAAAAASPVTPAQVRALILEARRAWEAQSRLGLASGDFDAWRRGALWDCRRRQSFRTLDQGDFDVALAHFRRLAGDPRGAGEEESAAAGDLRRALWDFRRLCRKYDAMGLFAPHGAEAYCQEVAKDVFKKTIRQLDAAEVRRILLTLASRALAKRGAVK